MESSDLSIDRIVEFFDRRAADYDREYSDETPAGYVLRTRRAKVLDLFDKPGGAVLDVGCGPGVMTRDLLDRGCRFCGIDPSPNMIAIARTRFRGEACVEFHRGEAGRLKFPADTFDAVLCMGVIDSLPNGPAAIREMVRVLKPGGTLILTFTNALSPYAWWKNYVFYPAVERWHRLRRAVGDPTLRPERVRSGSLRRLYTRRRAYDIVAGAGAAVLAVVPYQFNVLLSPIDELFPGLTLGIMGRLERANRRGTRWLAAGCVLKAQKEVR